MLRETGHLKMVSTKGKIKVVLGMTFLLIIVIVCGCIFKSLQTKQREREEIAQLFQVYQPYGLVYNEEKNRLYYNGELVRYFEDIISTEHYIKWPERNGEVDVYAERNDSGEISGVNSFTHEAFTERTSYMRESTYGLEVMINKGGYTDNVEEMVKERIAEEYEIYEQYGLIYDRKSDRLYYNGDLVGYFEDRSISHFFGPFEDSTIKVYAVRDKHGDITELDVDTGIQ